jgi:hypothetical protein
VQTHIHIYRQADILERWTDWLIKKDILVRWTDCKGRHNRKMDRLANKERHIRMMNRLANKEKQAGSYSAIDRYEDRLYGKDERMHMYAYITMLYSNKHSEKGRHK